MRPFLLSLEEPFDVEFGDALGAKCAPRSGQSGRDSRRYQAALCRTEWSREQNRQRAGGPRYQARREGRAYAAEYAALRDVLLRHSKGRRYGGAVECAVQASRG